MHAYITIFRDAVGHTFAKGTAKYLTSRVIVGEKGIQYTHAGGFNKNEVLSN